MMEFGVHGCVARAAAAALRGEGEVAMGGPRVGLVCGHFDPARDGVADYTRQLARHLRSVGLEPLVCTAHSYARSYAGTSEDRVVGVTERWNAGGVFRAARELARLRLDVVHVQFAPSAYGFSRAVGLLPRLVPAGMPVVVTLHEYGVWAPGGVAGPQRSAAWSAMERRRLADRETLLLTPRAARLLTTGTGARTRVLRARFAGGLTAVQVPVASNIPASPIDPEPAHAAARSMLGLPPDIALAVFFGFLHPEKGLERLIEAVAQVRRAHPRLRLILAGGLESHSVLGAEAAALRTELGQVARRHGIADAVAFTGHLPEQDISRLLRAADVAVFPFNAGVTAKSDPLPRRSPTACRPSRPHRRARRPARPRSRASFACHRATLRPSPTRYAASCPTGRWPLGWPGLAAPAPRAVRGRALPPSTPTCTPRCSAGPTAACAVGNSRQAARLGHAGKEGTRMSLLERLVGQARRQRAAVLARRPRAGVPAGARDTEDPGTLPAAGLRRHRAPARPLNGGGEQRVVQPLVGRDNGRRVRVLRPQRLGAHRDARLHQVRCGAPGGRAQVRPGRRHRGRRVGVQPRHHRGSVPHRCALGGRCRVVGAARRQPYSIVAGNPAKVLRQIPRPGEPAADLAEPQAGAAGDVAAG